MKLLKRIKLIVLMNILIYLKQRTMAPNNENFISSMFGANYLELNLLISSIIFIA